MLDQAGVVVTAAVFGSLTVSGELLSLAPLPDTVCLAQCIDWFAGAFYRICAMKNIC